MGLGEVPVFAGMIGCTKPWQGGVSQPAAQHSLVQELAAADEYSQRSIKYCHRSRLASAIISSGTPPERACFLLMMGSSHERDGT